MTAQLAVRVSRFGGPFSHSGGANPSHPSASSGQGSGQALTLSRKGVRLWRVALITKWLVRGRVYSYFLAVKCYIMDCETYLQAIGGSAMALAAVNQGILLVRVPLWITTSSCAEY